MRLYLSSFRMGNQPSELANLAPMGRAALILNALDNAPEAREHWRASQTKDLAALGMTVSDLDLREFFGAPAKLHEVLDEFDLVWVNGGNSFILRRAMTLSGFDTAIKGLLQRDLIVYSGFSAATVVAAPSLRGLETIDDPNDIPDGYPSEVVWRGLELLPFSVVVHYRSDHPEADAAEWEIAYFEREGIPYRVLRDGEAILVRGDVDDLTVVGSANN